jgi:uncharacterized protein (DUF4415 family)
MSKQPADEEEDDNDPASRPDEENPEWTLEDFRNARPALEVFAEIWGPEVAEMLRRGRGRPAKPDKKVNQTLRLDPDVLDAFRQEGPGWQSRINQILRENMPKSPA